MKKYRYLILLVVIAIATYFSWRFFITSPLDNRPKKAKLVKFFYKHNKKVYQG